MSSFLRWRLHHLDPLQGLGPRRAALDHLDRELTADHSMLDAASKL